MTNLWVTPSDLGTTYSASEFADDACQVASNILWAMSGRKYNGSTTVTERYITAIDAFRYQGASAKNFFPYMIHGSVYNLPAEDWNDSAYQSDGTSSLSRLRLRGQPVQEVHMMRSLYNGQIISPDSYYIAEHSTLIAYNGTPWPPGNVEVTYTYGAKVPTAGRMAAKTFAIELIRLWSGDDCALPDRVTSVSRQGVSYTILDNQDFLENMRIGIYEIDLFLKTANPSKALAPSKVFSPDMPKARRAAPSRSVVLTPSASYDVALSNTNNFTDAKTYTVATSALNNNPLSNYNNANYRLKLVASSYSGTITKEYSSASAAFRTTSGITYLDLSFDYTTTFQAIGPNHPGTWTLYAVDGTGATLALLTGNLQIKKVTSAQVNPSTTSVDVPTKFICKQGSTFVRTVTWSKDGLPVSLTNYTAAMQVRSSYASSTPVVSLTSSSGIALGGNAGTIQITISASATAAIPAGNYVYDLELTSGGTVTRLLEGQFIVTPEVTH
jgi:hypothetical protein